MDQLAVVVNIITAVALVSGLFFAAFEWRSSRLERRRQAQVLLLRSFDSPEFTKAMRRILALPEGQTRTQVEAALGPEGLDILWYWLGAMESIGIFVFTREIDIHMVDRSFGGPVIVTWRNLRGYADSIRAEVGRDSMHEWYQWLAERLMELERGEGRTAAHVREKDWRP
jgi:hypothetical protein